MHYSTADNAHGLRFNPFKALVVPRPIGWISTVGRDGARNLAPYSFFNAVSDRPPVVMFSSSGHKDTVTHVEETGEFTCSLATWELRERMNLSSAPVAHGVDEAELAGLPLAPSRFVKPGRVAASPAALECRHWKTIELPAPDGDQAHAHYIVFGHVVAVYIDDAFIRDGVVNTVAMRPLARLGYMEYAVLSPETTFTLNRPTLGADGRSAEVSDAPWDGVYR